MFVSKDTKMMGLGNKGGSGKRFGSLKPNKLMYFISKIQCRVQSRSHSVGWPKHLGGFTTTLISSHVQWWGYPSLTALLRVQSLADIFSACVGAYVRSVLSHACAHSICEDPNLNVIL